MATAVADKPKINPAYIAQYVALRERKRTVDVMSRNLGKLISLMEFEMLERVSAETHPKDPVRKIEIGGWELALAQKPKSISWATEFVKRCGASVADAVKKAAGTKTILAVRALTRSATRVEEEAKEEAELLYKPAA